MIFIPQYKNNFLRILILTPFLILGGFIFCSCENFGIKSMNIGMYLMIPSGIEKENIEIFINQESSKIYQAYSSTEDKSKFIESFEIRNEDISKTNFLKEFNKTNNDVIYVSKYKYYFDPDSKNIGPEMDRDFYILIPKEYKISAPFKEKTDEDYAHFLSHDGYYGSNFESKVKNNNNEYKLFYSLPKHFYKDSLTRRKFTENIEFEITGTINGKEISEIVNFVVKIPYLLSDYNCSAFRVKTKNFGTINLLYLYYLN